MASKYRPGLIRFGGDDFCISVSLPIVELADSVPPRALIAWDRRLLVRSQSITLLICGLRDVYPPLTPNGTYAPSRLETKLTFKVGLTQRYKPSKQHAKDAQRVFGMLQEDAEDQLERQKELQMELDAQIDVDGEGPVVVVEPKVVEDDDPGRFEKFSLSSSLETLLDGQLLRLIQYRRKFGLGWSGAEMLFAEVERLQIAAETLVEQMKDVRH